MNPQPDRAELTGRPDRAVKILRGRRLLVARMVWVAVSALAVGLFIVSLPAHYNELLTLSIYDPAVRDTARSNLTDLGVSAGFYAGYLVALVVALAAVCFVVGVLIFWRRSNEPVALFVALVLVLLGATFSGSTEALERPVWGWMGDILGEVSSVSALLFFYLFPDGRFVPRWTRFLAVALVAVTLPAALFPGLPFGSEGWTRSLYVAFMSCWLLTGIVAQIYRYRRVSGALERQQTKWVVFGFTAAIAGFLAVISLSLVFPSLEPGSLADFAGAAAVCCFMLFIPLSVGFAILRYRLWDIDVVINRALVYGSLTGMLALVYIGGVVTLQYTFNALTSQEQQPQIAVVASTLTIAALFNPLRRRIQEFIDRLFYRKKYDAAKTLKDFSAKLRDETDLGDISSDVIRVVRDTLEPEQVSLWLRPPPEK